MSDKAKNLIRQALQLYQTDDGASLVGSYRDLMTDLIHTAFADEELRKEMSTPSIETEEALDYWGEQIEFTFNEAWSAFKEEIEMQEHERLCKIPKKDLPLVNDEWLFLP